MKAPFPLADSSSLLFRLEMEKGHSFNGVDLGDRWRELAAIYEEGHPTSNNALFYDLHPVFTFLLGGKADLGLAVIEEIREQAELAGKRLITNCAAAKEVGVALANGIKAFVDGEPGTTVDLLVPVRYRFQELLGASHAQKDVFDLLLLRAAINAGRKNLAGQLLEERVARCGVALEDQQGTFNSGMAAAIMKM